jgi:chitin synthase
MNKIASTSETLTSEDLLTLALSDQIYSPCYKCESTNSFAIRHNFALGQWIYYDSSAGFVSLNILQSVSSSVQPDSFLKELFTVLPGLNRSLLRTKIQELCQVLENARIWTAFTVKPTALQIFDPSSWDVSLVSSQVRTLHLAQHHARRKTADYTTDFSIPEFFDRYSSIFPRNMDTRRIPIRDSISLFMDGRKLPVGEWFIGNERVWVGELGWENLEGELDDCIAGVRSSEEILGSRDIFSHGSPMTLNENGSGYGFYAGGNGIAESREGLLDQAQGRYPKEITGDDRSYYYGMDGKERLNYEKDVEAKNVDVIGTTNTRKTWVFVVWFLTWPIPSFLLRYVGRMKRKDVQMAWREKVTICFFIFLLCGTVIFYIIFFQRLICPEFDKVDTHFG